MKRRVSFHVFAVLFIVFLISVLIRLPTLNRPLSKHHEFVTAVSLRIINIWEMEGASKFNFNPVMNYPGKANKHLNRFASTTGKMVDAEGNYYYVSHPPFAYIFPYLVFKLFRVKGTVLAIEIFHLVINFISALFVYLIIGTLRNKKSFETIDWTGILGVVVYLFSAGVLWFQSNTYMSDMLVHLFFITGVYFLLRLFNEQTSGKYFILFAVNLFLMIYTSWLGIIFAFCVVLYSLIRFKKGPFFRRMIWVTILASVISVGVFVYQFSLINGFDPFLDQMKHRLLVRTGWRNNPEYLLKVTEFFRYMAIIIYSYITSYFPFILLFGYFLYHIIRKSEIHFKFNGLQFLFMWISVVPIIILHTFLPQYSTHDFSTLYGSLFLSVALAILFEKLKKDRGIQVRRLRLLVLLSVLISVSSYYYINRPGKISIMGDPYNIGQQLGIQIKNTSTNDAIIFAIGEAEIHPQLIFYAQRNIKEVSTREEAYEFLKSRQINKGIIYYSSAINNPQFDQIEEISLSTQPSPIPSKK